MPFSEAERVALYHYTEAGFGPLNRALRQIDIDPAAAAAVRPFAGVLEAALAKLPFRAGAVRRGQFQDPGWRSGTVVNDLQFLSTSTDARGAGYGRYDVQFMIEAKRSRAIAPWSAHPGEAEALYPTDALFEVTDIVDDGRQKTYFLREVD